MATARHSGAHHGQRLGGAAFNHSADQGTEREYDRLRDLARSEHAKMASCFDRAHAAHGSGNGALAHELSSEGQAHKQKAEQANAQASQFIFRANNSEGRVAADTIDLHGQFVDEAEEILEARIRQAAAENQTHLHVIVGKGNHSPGHIQKIKPRVEQVCRELGLAYRTEENEGRVYVELRPGGGGGPGPGGQPGYDHGQYGAQPGYPGQAPPQYGRPQQQFEQDGGGRQDDPIAKCLKSCCSVM